MRHEFESVLFRNYATRAAYKGAVAVDRHHVPPDSGFPSQRDQSWHDTSVKFLLSPSLLRSRQNASWHQAAVGQVLDVSTNNSLAGVSPLTEGLTSKAQSPKEKPKTPPYNQPPCSMYIPMGTAVLHWRRVPQLPTAPQYDLWHRSIIAAAPAQVSWNCNEAHRPPPLQLSGRGGRPQHGVWHRDVFAAAPVVSHHHCVRHVGSSKLLDLDAEHASHHGMCFESVDAENGTAP